MEIRRGGGGCDALLLYIEKAQPISRRPTLYSVPNIRGCLPRPVSCHTPGSGAVSTMRDRHNLAQGLPVPRMLCTCTPGFGYPGCRIVASKLRRRPPSVAAVGELRRRAPSASSVGELRRRAPSASSVGLCRRPSADSRVPFPP